MPVLLELHGADVGQVKADMYAAHLLMPAQIFVPMVRVFGEPNFQNLTKIADELETSSMATALRLANINTLPVIVASYNLKRVMKYVESPGR